MALYAGMLPKAMDSNNTRQAATNADAATGLSVAGCRSLKYFESGNAPSRAMAKAMRAVTANKATPVMKRDTAMREERTSLPGDPTASTKILSRNP